MSALHTRGHRPKPAAARAMERSHWLRDWQAARFGTWAEASTVACLAAREAPDPLYVAASV